jgi:hypothetical protein
MSDEQRSLARTLLVDAIRPALATIDKGGLAAEQLLLGTAIQESRLIYRQQLGGGPALGLFQMETATHDDCWDNYLRFRAPLAMLVRQTLGPGEHATAMTMKTNDRYAATMCRIRYVRAPAPLPPADDVQALAYYWKQYYNTVLGKGMPSEFIAKWSEFVDGNTFS